ncbi:hypothetical protein RVIR1_11570 [Candidatus Rickettsiella viridis]|uniref:Uncharacterized protein n=1 Tax=Candidatus Rickettsiella viridis TaxID=676208 RepID=A0A2Z5UX76_9COXI|nr:hypothetical protein RVIR1_11570 [Candidatus Rickettsiella viridis]
MLQKEGGKYLFLRLDINNLFNFYYYFSINNINKKQIF